MSIINGEKVLLSNTEIENEQEVLKKYENKADMYQFTFVYDKDHYVLKNVVKK